MILQVVLLLAIILRLWGMGFGLPLKVHPDEVLITDNAALAVSSGQLKPSFYHWPSFIIYLLFFEYLLTYFVGNIIGVFSSAADLFIAYKTNPTFYFWLGRITTTLFCIGGMSCIYLIGKRISGRNAGIAAAVLMGFDAIFVEHSRYITPDIPAVALMIYAWYCLLDYIESGNVRILYSAAFVGGVAMSTKYNAALMLVPILIAAASRVQHWPSGDIPSAFKRYGKYLILCVFFFIIGFLIFTPYSILDAKEFWRQFSQQLSHQGVGHIGMEAGGSAMMEAAAHFYSPYGLALLMLALAGIPAITKPVRHGIILLIFPVLYMLTLAGWVVWAERYMLFLLPVFFIYAGVTIGRIGGFIGRSILRKPEELVVACFALLLVMPSLVDAVGHAKEISKVDTRVAATIWIEENIPEYGRLFIEKGGPEPYHVDDITEIGLDVSPVYYYTEPKVWFSIESVSEEPLVKLRSLNPPPEYIVSSGYTHDRYYREEVQRSDQELVKPWIAYYTFIEANCELIHEINPGDDLTGPWIKFYKVPKGLLGK